jgi:hypothetical protein
VAEIVLAARAENPKTGSMTMIFDQATSRGIRAQKPSHDPHRRGARLGGSLRDCFSAGATARGLSCHEVKMIGSTRLRIENEFSSTTTTVDLNRDACDAFFDLAYFVRRVNRRGRKGPRGSLHLREDGTIILRWYDPSVVRFARGIAPKLRPEDKQAPTAEVTQQTYLQWQGRLAQAEQQKRRKEQAEAEALTELVAFAIRNGRPGEAKKKTRVKIVDEITAHTTIVESCRSRAEVYLDLCRLARQTNSRRDDMVRATVGLSPELITIRWFCPWLIAIEVAAEMLELAAPIHAVEQILWPRPSQDVVGVSP